MKAKATKRYLATNILQSIGIFYLIISILLIGIYLLMLRYSAILEGTVNIRLTGSHSSSALFLFIVGLNSFKENHAFMLQNGVSRKTLFSGLLWVGFGAAMLMTMADFVFDTLSTWGLSGLGVLTMDSAGPFFRGFETNTILQQLILSFLELGTAFFGGLMITTLFYRMNKAGKILVPVGVFLLATASSVDVNVTHSIFAKILLQVAAWTQAGMLNYSVYTVAKILLLLSAFWLLMRKAPIKTNLS